MRIERVPVESKEKKEKRYKLHIKKRVIPIDKEHKLDSKSEYDLIKQTLSDIYKDKLMVDKSLILRCVGLTCNDQDEANFLPYGLIVEKDGDELIFRTDNKRNLFLIFLFITIFAFLLVSASYVAIDFLSKINLNKDINGDGIPDINLDLDGDGVAEVNIDINHDDVPDINIDYKNNKMAMFNIDLTQTLSADTNKVITVKGGVCKKDQINCDTTGDGWPDTNIDIDGDGVADLDIDTDEDGVADLNVDSNSDGTCDINCDDNDDWKCDYNCIDKEYIKVFTKLESGNPNVNSSTSGSDLYVIFRDSEEITVENLYPDDQGPGYNTTVPDKVFTLENKTGIEVPYTISWIVYENTFIEVSTNFQFEITSTNGGSNLDWTPYPAQNAPGEKTIVLRGTILPYVIQTYTVKTTLKGKKVNGQSVPQNEEQGKTFSGKIEVKEDFPNVIE